MRPLWHLYLKLFMNEWKSKKNDFGWIKDIWALAISACFTSNRYCGLSRIWTQTSPTGQHLPASFYSNTQLQAYILHHFFLYSFFHSFPSFPPCLPSLLPFFPSFFTPSFPPSPPHLFCPSSHPRPCNMYWVLYAIRNIFKYRVYQYPIFPY